MKHISKATEPRTLADWKEINQTLIESGVHNWESVPTEVKRDIHASLLSEQGHICCYCGDRIAVGTSHVEHLRPRSKYDREWLFDYDANLMASCNGGTSTGNRKDPVLPKHIHCGPRKGDWFDEAKTVSPLHEDCEHFFKFTLDGRIIASADPARREAAEQTIDHLNLNSERLRNGREEAVKGIFGYADDEDACVDLSNAELVTIINDFNKRDAEGRYRKFCITVADLARQLLQT